MTTEQQKLREMSILGECWPETIDKTIAAITEAERRKEPVKVTGKQDGMGYVGIPNPNFIARCGECKSVVTSLDSFCRQCGVRLEWI